MTIQAPLVQVICSSWCQIGPVVGHLASEAWGDMSPILFFSYKVGRYSMSLIIKYIKHIKLSYHLFWGREFFFFWMRCGRLSPATWMTLFLIWQRFVFVIPWMMMLLGIHLKDGIPVHHSIACVKPEPEGLQLHLELHRGGAIIALYHSQAQCHDRNLMQTTT